jgi:hypothetical protein
MPLLLAIYLIGVAVGLWRIDAPPARRVGLALLWPLALLACGVTLTTLLVAAGVLFPVVGVVMLGAAVTVWWLLR